MYININISYIKFHKLQQFSFELIDDSTFYGCVLLPSITLPNSGTSIGDLFFFLDADY